jgi:hypothetical protein
VVGGASVEPSPQASLPQLLDDVGVISAAAGYYDDDGKDGNAIGPFAVAARLGHASRV